MTRCPVLECIHNDRLDLPRCTLLNEVELDDEACCINFKADNEYLRFEFKEGRGHLRNLEKARLVNLGRCQPSIGVRAENLHVAARDFFVREEK